MSLAGLLGGYGSDSEAEDSDQLSPGAPTGGLLGGPASSEDGAQALDSRAVDRVVDGPSTNPEPPPEGLSPRAPHHAAGGDASPAGRPDAPDSLDLLPPELREAPPGEPHPLVLERICDLHTTQRVTGLTVMGELRSNRKWCNPDFLEKMVAYYGLDQYGSSFSPDVWSPTALPPEDYWPQLEKEMAAVAARRAEERARRTTIPFSSAGHIQQPPPVPPSGAGALQQQAVRQQQQQQQHQQRVAALQAEFQAKAQAMTKKASKWDK